MPRPSWWRRRPGPNASSRPPAMVVQLWSALQAILNGILTGSLYSLIGMGMALIFGVMRIVNFAHGAFMMLGMYVAFELFDKLGVTPYIGFVAAAGVLFVIGFVAYHGLLRWIADRSDFMQILLTLGIAQISIGNAQQAFSGDFRQVNLPVRSVIYRLGSHLAFNAGDTQAFAITVAVAV